MADCRCRPFGILGDGRSSGNGYWYKSLLLVLSRQWPHYVCAAIGSAQLWATGSLAGGGCPGPSWFRRGTLWSVWPKESRVGFLGFGRFVAFAIG